MATPLHLHFPLKQDLFGIEVQRCGFVVEREPRYLPHGTTRVGIELFVRGVVQIDPAVVEEIRIERDSDQSFLGPVHTVTAAVSEHIERAGERHFLGCGIPHVDGSRSASHVWVGPVGDRFDTAAAADVEHAAVIGDRESVEFAYLIEFSLGVGLRQAGRFVVVGVGRIRCVVLLSGCGHRRQHGDR